MNNNLHPDNDLIVQGQTLDTESFRVNPNPVPGSLDEKTSWRLEDIYSEIRTFRRVPASVYTDPSVMAREWDLLWTKTWLYAGHVCDLRQAGDWFRFDIGRESIIVARAVNGNINAYFNACRHRGVRLADQDFGHDETGFMCPSHGWRFDLEGRNIRIVDRDTFACELVYDVDLIPVRCEVQHGLVFVTMNSEAVCLREYLGDMGAILASYKMESMHFVKDAQYAMPANWKTAIDGFQEAYHAQTTHPEFKPIVDDYFQQVDFYPFGHSRALTPFLRVSHRLSDRTTLTPGFLAALEEAGIDANTFEGGPADARRAVQLAKRRSDNPYGLDYSGFTDDQLTDDWNLSIFPNVLFNAHAEGVLINRFRPHPTDVDKSYFDLQILVPKLRPGTRLPAYMGLEADTDISGNTRPARIYLEAEQSHALGPVFVQDAAVLKKAQLGLHSKGTGGYVRFAEHERRLQQFHAEIDLYVNGNR